MDINGIGGVSATTPTPQTQNASQSASSSASNQSSSSTSVTSNYTSPITTFDRQTGALILEYRDVKTGEETYQIPSEAAQLYQRAQHLDQVAQAAQTDTKGAKPTAG